MNAELDLDNPFIIFVIKVSKNTLIFSGFKIASNVIILKLDFFNKLESLS